MKIVFRAAAVLCGIGLTLAAAMGDIHPSRFEYAVLWGLITLSCCVSLLETIMEKVKRGAASVSGER